MRDSRLLLGTWNSGIFFVFSPFHPFDPEGLQAILTRPSFYTQLGHHSIPPLGEKIAVGG